MVRVADLMETFSKEVTTICFYQLNKITEIFIDTILSYPLDNLPKRYKKSLLKKTNLTMKENIDIMKIIFSN